MLLSSINSDLQHALDCVENAYDTLGDCIEANREHLEEIKDEGFYDRTTTIIDNLVDLYNAFSPKNVNEHNARKQLVDQLLGMCEEAQAVIDQAEANIDCLANGANFLNGAVLHLERARGNYARYLSI